jgi:hypothetical protein
MAELRRAHFLAGLTAAGAATVLNTVFTAPPVATIHIAATSRGTDIVTLHIEGKEVTIAEPRPPLDWGQEIANVLNTRRDLGLAAKAENGTLTIWRADG